MAKKSRAELEASIADRKAKGLPCSNDQKALNRLRTDDEIENLINIRQAGGKPNSNLKAEQESRGWQESGY